MIPEQTIQQVIDTARIEEVVGEVVHLKKRGVNFIGNCPFHDERTPSFTVSPVKGIYKCFGCGAAGNVVRFVMEHDQLTYPDAIRRLANKYNIEIAEIAVSPEVKAEQQQRESLLIVNQLVAEYFEQQLFETDEGRSIGLGYFKERGLREDIIRRFQLGFAPDSPQSLLQFAQTKGINPQTLEQLGIIVQKDDRQWAFFRKRVQFAIHNPQAKVVAFAGRTLSSDKKQAKYINSPETEIYHKSKVLYGIHLAKKSIAQLNECYLVEGYTDVLSLVQNGIENVVASAGTALTVEQIRLIKRYTPNITILYDGDAAGIKAALRGIDLVLEEDMNLKVVLLPEPEDPDSYIRKIGKTDFEQYLRKNAKDFVLFKTQLLLKDIGDDPIARATLVRDIVTTITLIPDSIKRQIYVQKCAQLLLIDEQILINEVNKARLKNLKQQQKNAGTETAPDLSPEEIQYLTQQKPTANPNPNANYQESLNGMKLCEREMIRVLLEYGTYEIMEEIPVAAYLIHETQDIPYITPLHNEIIAIYTEQLERGIIPDSDFFINSSNEPIATLAIDVLTTPYAVSENWEKRDIFVTDKRSKFKKDVLNLLNRFKLYFVMKRLKELVQDMQNLQNGNEPESADQIMDLQVQFMQYTQRKLELCAALRLVIR